LNTLLIAGTDTNAGKTVCTIALAAYWQRYGHIHTIAPSGQPPSLGILKPLQTGLGDRERYLELFHLDQTLAQLNPIHFTAPLAPPLAADLEQRSIPLELAWQAFEHLRQTRDWVLVEALGGLGSPVTHETTVADLAWDWRIPTVLVVPVQLGAIGQAVANVALARQTKVYLKGIILNCVQPCTAEDLQRWASIALIESLTGIPVLGTIPYLRDLNDLPKLAQVASELTIERLLPSGALSYGT
jgi:dethiobiotin synthetase